MEFSISAGARAARMVIGGVLVALLGVGVVGGTPCAQAGQRPTDDGTTYDFQRHYKAGEVNRYKAEIVTTTNGPETGSKDRTIKYTIVIRETVILLNADKTMSLVSEYEQAVASVDGQNLDYTAKMPRITQISDAQGHARLIREGGTDPTAKVMVLMMAQASAAASGGMPDKPMKVGETWKLDAPDPNLKWSGTAGLESVENFNGAKTLKVNYRTDSTSPDAGGSSAHTGATMLVDVLSGKTIKLALRTDAQAGQTKNTVDIQYNHIEDPAAPISVVRRTYRVGEVDHYQYNVVMTTNDPQAGGNERVVKVALLVRETVKEVAPDGAATLVEETEKAGLSVNNTDLDVTAMMPTVTLIHNAQGGFEIKAEGGDAQLVSLVMPMLAQVVRAQTDVVPSKPLKVGGVWNFMSSAAEDVKTTGIVSLASVESLNGAKALVLKLGADMSGNGTPPLQSHDEATVWVDAQTGKTLKMNSRSTSGLGTANKSTVDVTYSLVGDKANAAGGSGK